MKQKALCGLLFFFYVVTFGQNSWKGGTGYLASRNDTSFTIQYSCSQGNIGGTIQSIYKIKVDNKPLMTITLTNLTEEKKLQIQVEPSPVKKVVDTNGKKIPVKKTKFKIMPYPKTCYLHSEGTMILVNGCDTVLFVNNDTSHYKLLVYYKSEDRDDYPHLAEITDDQFNPKYYFQLENNINDQVKEENKELSLIHI